jgi:t-SNARE complex subunit (syntaxin)
MESIVAFAFAVNIIQVVVWGQQTASFCLRVYRDEEIDPALSETIKNFRTATQSLQNSLSQDRISTEERGLLEIAQKCGHVADKLLKEVGPVSTSHKKRYLFKAYFKSSFKSSSIKKLKQELAVCQAALETQQLLDLR